MGRRKIEIRAIKDDRNRSVTFLKRKGGLFKKAHELSVLCSVDVAVIIFGHNKKLYEFSSGDINETLRRYNYYGQPHEHKGPSDFKNKGGDDDDEEEDEDEGQHIKEDSAPPPQHHGIPTHLQHHNSFQHIRPPQHASASPPMPNGMFPRHSTPQPQMDSRPASQNTVRRQSSSLVPIQHHPTPTPPQNGFAYVPNPPIYNPQAGPPMQQHPSPRPKYQQFAQSTPPLPQHQPGHPSPYMHHQQHQPRPASQPQLPRQDSLQPPPHPPARTSPQPPQQEFKPPSHSPPHPRHLSSKSRSIFTPIDEGGSVLAQHFFGSSETPRSAKKSSPDLRPPPRSVTAQPRVSPHLPQPSRPQTATTEFPPPQRSDTSGSRSGARPKLNLQIPSEASDNDESAIGNSPNTLRSANASANPARNDHIVLPPPSPSASAVLSAGAGGPPNPFARPPPPTSQNREAFHDNRNSVETPISALPSKYMSSELLPSPSNFFSEWGDFSRGGSGSLNSAVLPSPLGFPTPPDARGPGFGRPEATGEGAGGEGVVGGAGQPRGKRKNSTGPEGSGEGKRVKT